MELRTNRTVIHRRALPDASDLSAYYLRNAEHLKQWEPERPIGYHRQLAWIARLQHDASDGLHLIARLDDAPRDIAAVCSFTGISRGAFQACYLGFSLDARLQGQGLMFEVLQAALAHVFEDLRLHRVMASHLPENQRSAALLQRLGFQREGLARRYLKIAGEWRDHVLTARLCDDPPVEDR